MGASSLIVLMIAAVSFSGIAILISKFVLKASTNKQKRRTLRVRNTNTGSKLGTVQCGLLSLRSYIPDLRCGTDILVSMGSSGQTGWLAGTGGDPYLFLYSFHGIIICT